MHHQSEERAPLEAILCVSVPLVCCVASIAIVSHCDFHNKRARRKTIVFSACQDHVILYFDVTAFISCSWGDFVGFNPVPNRVCIKLSFIRAQVGLHDPL